MNFADIKINSVFSFVRTITAEDVDKFAKLTGDFNPLHTDKEFGGKSVFKKNIAHGMLLGSLFSTLVGKYCPGDKALYLSQTLNFRLPVFIDEQVEVRATVLNKSETLKIVIFKMEIFKKGEVAVNGEAKVKVLD